MNYASQEYHERRVMRFAGWIIVAICLTAILCVSASAQGVKFSNNDLKVKRAKLDALQKSYDLPTKASIDAAFPRPAQRHILYSLVGLAELTEQDIKTKHRPSKVHSNKPKPVKPVKPKPVKPERPRRGKKK